MIKYYLDGKVFMNKTIVITDSNSGLTQSAAKEINVVNIPMPFVVNGEEFLEDISITQDQFYVHLRDKGTNVSTSQPSLFYLEDLWTELLNDYEEIVYIPMSSGLSGTCANALKLAEEKFKDKVYVVDNKRISVTQRISVIEALNLIKLGKTGKEIKEYLEKTGKINSIYIYLDTLYYLRKGGRITAAAAALGTVLKIKPVLYSDGDSFDKFAMCRSITQAKKKMIDRVKDEVENGKLKEYYEQGKLSISVAHTQNYDEAVKFAEEVKAAFPNIKFRYIDQLSLSVACHIGPGALAVALQYEEYAD